MKKLLSQRSGSEETLVSRSREALKTFHMRLPAFININCQHPTVFDEAAFSEAQTVTHLSQFDVLGDAHKTDSATAELNPGSVMPSIAMMYWGGGDIAPEKMDRLKIINAKLERPLHLYVLSDKKEFKTGSGKSMEDQLKGLNHQCENLHIHLIPEHQVFPMRFEQEAQSQEFQTLWSLAQFEGHVMGNYSHKSDLLRYMWLSKFRGVYLDWDATSDPEMALINRHTLDFEAHLASEMAWVYEDTSELLMSLVDTLEEPAVKGIFDEAVAYFKTRPEIISINDLKTELDNIRTKLDSVIDKEHRVSFCFSLRKKFLWPLEGIFEELERIKEKEPGKLSPRRCFSTQVIISPHGETSGAALHKICTEFIDSYNDLVTHKNIGIPPQQKRDYLLGIKSELNASFADIFYRTLYICVKQPQQHLDPLNKIKNLLMIGEISVDQDCSWQGRAAYIGHYAGNKAVCKTMLVAQLNMLVKWHGGVRLADYQRFFDEFLGLEAEIEDAYTNKQYEIVDMLDNKGITHRVIIEKINRPEGKVKEQLQASLHYHWAQEHHIFWREELNQRTPKIGFIGACKEVIDSSRDYFDPKRYLVIHNDFDERGPKQQLSLTPKGLAGHCKGVVLMSHMPDTFYDQIQTPMAFTRTMIKSLEALDNPKFNLYGKDSKRAYYERFELVKDKLEAAMERKKAASRRKAFSKAIMTLSLWKVEFRK